MSELKFESLIPQEYTNLKTQFDDQSVIFILKGSNLPIIGYSGEFLFKRTVQHSTLKFTEPTDKSQINPNDNPEMCSNTEVFRYYERIKDMIFKYGLKRELYKNSHGHWVDMTAIRKNMGMFLNMITGVVDESLESGEFNTSIYVKVADYLINHPEEGSIFNQYIVDEKEIPRATYIDENGKYWSIGPGDGTISVTEPSGYQFKRYLESENIDNIHLKDDKYILFTESLSDYETGLEASKNYEENDAHKYDDLKLTFLHVDKTTPFTDLNNLLIFVNGLLVDYKKHPTLNNVIYLPNVKRLSSLQQVGLKKGYTPDQHSNYQIVGDTNCIYYEFDNSKCKYSYKFNIEIFKFDNVKFSHFIQPIDFKYILKTEAYSTNTYWLPYKLSFSNTIDKDKTILVCSGEIIPKDEWDIDPNDSHIVRLLYNDFEFEQLMNEMTTKMRIYLSQTIQHDIDNEPKLSDYILNYDSEDAINNGFQNYVTAMNEYIANVTGGLYDSHFAISAINTVIKQFDNRSYSLIKTDTIEDVNYDVQFFENHDDIIVDKPRINQLTNKNWSLDDILIVNGMKQQFVNVYQDKFKVPQTMWLMDPENVFEHCSAYKLQVIKTEK